VEATIGSGFNFSLAQQSKTVVVELGVSSKQSVYNYPYVVVLLGVPSAGVGD